MALFSTMHAYSADIWKLRIRSFQRAQISVYFVNAPPPSCFLRYSKSLASIATSTLAILSSFSSLLVALLSLWLLLLLLMLSLVGSWSIIRVVDFCTAVLHEMILVLWLHTDETRLKLLRCWLGWGHCTAIYTHIITGSSAHLRSSEHAGSHELPCHGRRHASAVVHWHVAIFSWGCMVNAIHLLLRLHHLLHLHHVLLLEYNCHPRVGCLTQLCQLGHLTTVGKLLDIILCG